MRGKVVFITGGGSGIGKETALLCAKNGAEVVIVGDINLEKIYSVAEEIKQLGAKEEVIHLDVSKPESIENALKQIIEKFGRIDIVVNSAGICTLTSFNEVTVDEWEKVMDINARGTFLCCQKAINIMVKKAIKGSIVNISSVASKVGGISASVAYSSSKACVVTLTMAAAKYAAKFGIRVNCVSPGLVDTSMANSFSEDDKKKILSGIPLSFYGQPEDVAEAIVFLASSKARFITGEILDVNGGSFMD